MAKISTSSSSYFKVIGLTAVSVFALFFVFSFATFNFLGGTDIMDETVALSSVEDIDDAIVAEPVEAYPTGWLLTDTESIPSLYPVEIKSLPGFDVQVHKNGQPVLDTESQEKTKAPTLSNANKALVSHNGKDVEVDPSKLLINLPDFLPSAIYDVKYAYNTPTRAGGREIEHLTGTQLPGYVAQMRNEYLGRDEFAVPVAYDTAIKLSQASSIFESDGYKLVFWDTYRPYCASQQLSSAFQLAYNKDDIVKTAVGDWDISWYVAQGASAHNFATAVDISLADESGTIYAMPSDFDALDITAHLTDSQLSSSDITEDAYTMDVKSNPACLELHKVMKKVGFSELASEWWHFEDSNTTNNVRNLVGPLGMDFTAYTDRTA